MTHHPTVEIEDAWRVVDEWWKEEPLERFFVVLVARDRDDTELSRVAVRFERATGEWTLEGGSVT